MSAATSKAEDADKEEEEQEVLVNTEGLEELKTMLDECSSLYDAVSHRVQSFSVIIHIVNIFSIEHCLLPIASHLR